MAGQPRDLGPAIRGLLPREPGTTSTGRTPAEPPTRQHHPGPASHQQATVPEGRTVLANAPDRLGGQRNGERKHGDCPCETGPRRCTKGAGRKRHRRRPHLSRSKRRLSSTGPGLKCGRWTGWARQPAPSCRPSPSRRSPPERCPLPAGPGRPEPRTPTDRSSRRRCRCRCGRRPSLQARLSLGGAPPIASASSPPAFPLPGHAPSPNGALWLVAAPPGGVAGPGAPRVGGGRCSWRPGRGPASPIAVPAFHGAPRGEGSLGRGRGGPGGAGRAAARGGSCRSWRNERCVLVNHQSASSSKEAQVRPGYLSEDFQPNHESVSGPAPVPGYAHLLLPGGFCEAFCPREEEVCQRRACSHHGCWPWRRESDCLRVRQAPEQTGSVGHQ